MQLSVREVAKLLNVSEKTIYRWLRSGILPAYRVNDQYRFNKGEILEWATSRKVGTSIDFFEEPESADIQLPTLAEAIRDGGIFYRVGGTDKDSVLKNLVETMRLPDGVDREFVTQVLRAREALGTTAIGDGIAIPHVRNPIVLHVNRPLVTVCFLDHPVDFGALDGIPVHTLFAIISPTVRAHLHLLARLSYALRTPGFKQSVDQQASREVLLAEASKVEETIRQASRESTGTGG
jgi:PTS system nitrogen regulatory IIA component